MGRPPKELNVGTDGERTDRTLKLDEVGNPGPIEKVSETEFAETAELEAFMNEMVLIIVHPTTEDGANEIITPNVNGVNQGIIRGKPIRVKRKYVEALARGRTTAYKQSEPDPRDPSNIKMEERTACTYPFSVLEDSEMGKAWLKAIEAQP